MNDIGFAYPNLDPIAFAYGPIIIRWYALAYITGFLGGWGVAAQLLKRYAGVNRVASVIVDDLLVYVIFGIILGGRIGYVLFYNGAYYLQHPGDVLQLWQGGMSFHGGLIGSLIGMALYARRNEYKFLEITDVAAAVTPIGLFFGRLANFVNDELFGRVTDVPWAVRFPNGDFLPRHPSQLYEAGLEGIVLFAVMMALATRPATWNKKGLLSGVFLIGYALARTTAEFFREPDIQIGFLFNGVTMGQILCIPMLIAGALILWQRGRA